MGIDKPRIYWHSEAPLEGLFTPLESTRDPTNGVAILTGEGAPNNGR